MRYETGIAKLVVACDFRRAVHQPDCTLPHKRQAVLSEDAPPCRSCEGGVLQQRHSSSSCGRCAEEQCRTVQCSVAPLAHEAQDGGRNREVGRRDDGVGNHHPPPQAWASRSSNTPWGRKRQRCLAMHGSGRDSGQNLTWGWRVCGARYMFVDKALSHVAAIPPWNIPWIF